MRESLEQKLKRLAKEEVLNMIKGEQEMKQNEFNEN